MAFDPNRSIFAGMSQDQLASALASAQGAYLSLSMGSKEVAVSYSQNDGAKSVTFKQTSLADLRMLILELRAVMNPAQFPNPRGGRPVLFR